MEKLTKEEQERLGLYTGRFQALWDNYFFRMEAREHRKNTIGLDPTPEEKIMIEEHKEWFKNQSWNQEEYTTNKQIERIDMEKTEK